MEGVLHAKNWPEGAVNTPDSLPVQLTIDPSLLEAKFGFIGQVAELAAAAVGELFDQIGFDPFPRQGAVDKSHQTPVSMAGILLNLTDSLALPV